MEWRPLLILKKKMNSKGKEKKSKKYDGGKTNSCKKGTEVNFEGNLDVLRLR